MKTSVLVLSLAALAAPSYAAQKHDDASLARYCRQFVGREVPEATDGRSHEGQLNVQRFSDCLMSVPRR